MTAPESAERYYDRLNDERGDVTECRDDREPPDNFDEYWAKNITINDIWGE